MTQHDKPDTGKTIAVIGATGLQGRTVTHHLLADGWRVRAITRSPQGRSATELAAAGAEIVTADMDDPASLRTAFNGAYGVFSVQPTVGSPGTAPDFGADDEVRWGRNVAEAAHVEGVAHFVYSSVAGAGRHADEVLPENLVSKWRIEQRIIDLALPATILRPVSFMENYSAGYHLRDGAVAAGFAAHIPQQLIAVDDVGAFTALAFAHPADWIGTTLDIAGDELTPTEIAAAISTAIGRDLPYVAIPLDEFRKLGDNFAYAYEWLNHRGYRADLAETHRRHPARPADLRTWLDTTGARQISAFLRQGNDQGVSGGDTP